jgi:hypothetical protein
MPRGAGRVEYEGTGEETDDDRVDVASHRCTFVRAEIGPRMPP